MHENSYCDVAVASHKTAATLLLSGGIKAATGITLKIVVVELQSRTNEHPQTRASNTPEAELCRVIRHADKSPAGSQAKQPP